MRYIRRLLAHLTVAKYRGEQLELPLTGGGIVPRRRPRFGPPVRISRFAIRIPRLRAR